MVNQPTSLQIRERAERRCAELGITRPDLDSPSYEAKLAVFERVFDRQLTDAEIALNRAYELEHQREDERAARARQETAAFEARLAARFHAQSPHGTTADLEAARSRLIAEQAHEDGDVLQQMRANYPRM